MTDTKLTVCSNCAAAIQGPEAEEAGWRYWSDGAGELHLVCAVCAYRELRADAPDSLERPQAGDAPPPHRRHA